MEQQLKKAPMRRGALKPLSSQGGYSLAIALVFALILSFVAASIGRKALQSNDGVMGLTFRQAAGTGSDRAMLIAAQWLNANASSLANTNAANGYYAVELKNVDWTGMNTPALATDDVDWDGTNASAALKAVAVPGTDAAGNSSAYVIQRLCDVQGTYTATSGVQCMTYINTNVPSNYKQGILYNVSAITTTTMLYYRVTVRTVGPKGSVSYTQSLVLVNI